MSPIMTCILDVCFCKLSGLGSWDRVSSSRGRKRLETLPKSEVPMLMMRNARRAAKVVSLLHEDLGDLVFGGLAMGPFRQGFKKPFCLNEDAGDGLVDPDCIRLVGMLCTLG